MSRKAFSLVAVVTAVLVILAFSDARAQSAVPATKAQKSPAGNSQNGKRLFTSYGCYECHGYQAEVTSVVGPRLGPDPISFPAFVEYVRQPTGEMPPFTSKVITDAELADIYAFLQSLPRPTNADSIPALK